LAETRTASASLVTGGSISAALLADAKIINASAINTR
jgi:hypothetical protein